MSRVRAWERIHDIEYSSRLTMFEFYELLIAAGYSDEESQTAASERGWQRLEAGVKM